MDSFENGDNKVYSSNPVTITDDFPGYSSDTFCLTNTYLPYIEKILIPAGVINDRVERIAYDINQRFHDEELYMLCILKGGFKFFNLLVDKLQSIRRTSNSEAKPIFLEFIRVKSYVNTTSTGNVEVSGMFDVECLKGKNVVIVEDIIDTGRTIAKLQSFISELKPKDLKITCLLRKRVPTSTGYKPDYLGFDVPNHFLIGWACDYNQYFRDLDHICTINQKGIEHYGVKSRDKA